MADQRAQYNEEAVGANHPTKADVINRLALVEHGTDGVHGAAARASMGTAPLVLGSDADGDMYYRASGALARLAKGTAYAIPRMNSGASAPEWGSAGQIVFPATQNASSNANTLDDYKEGTWIPALVSTGASWTYNGQTGTYTKIGRMLFLQFLLSINVLSGTTTNTTVLSGLPYTIKFATGRTSISLGMPVEPTLYTDAGTTLSIRSAVNGTDMLASGIPSGCYVCGFIIGHTD